MYACNAHGYVVVNSCSGIGGVGVTLLVSPNSPLRLHRSSLSGAKASKHGYA